MEGIKMPRIKIGDRWIGENEQTYFIADIAANHDGDLDRAKTLIHLAAKSGADAAKFQNFQAQKIVSRYGFSVMKQLSHQAKWKKSVYQIYMEASLPWEWTKELKEKCDSEGIDYLSTPYDLEVVDMLNPYVPAFKIGSGDITWPEILETVANKGKPVLLATGASNIYDVRRAVNLIYSINPDLVIMQCNTNYTCNKENFKYINLNVLKTYQALFPDCILGLSDHTPGHATTLGAITLGARVIEKHFTDDIAREGPDHLFSMTPETWREMVDRSRELEASLGNSEKKIENNEKETAIVQRRCLRAAQDIKAGTILNRELIDILRPAPSDAIYPYDLKKVIGKVLKEDIPKGDTLRLDRLEDS